MSLGTTESGSYNENSGDQTIKKINSASTNKRPLKQFSVKNSTNSVTSFKTNFGKHNTKHNSLHELNDYCTSNSHSPKSISSATSFNKSRSSEDICRRKRNNSKSMFNHKLNSRQLSKSLSRNSTQSKKSKQSMNNADDIKLNPAIPPKDMNELGKSNMSTNLNKTFHLQSDSDYEDLDENAQFEEIEQNTHSTSSQEDDINERVTNVASPLENHPASSHSMKVSQLGGSDGTSESIEYKNLLNSNSKLLAIDKDSLYQDKSKLSYLVPSSFRTNSRVSADRISTNAILKAGSQNYADLISSGMMEDALDDNNDNVNTLEDMKNGSFDNDKNRKFNINKSEIANDNNNSSEIDNNSNMISHEDDQIIKPHMMFEQENYNISLEPQFKQEPSHQNLENAEDKKEIKYTNVSSNLKQDGGNNMEYSSFSSSFMHDKDTDHKFNYINRDFINSSTSTEIKKYFSTNEKSTTTENASDSSDLSRVSNQNTTIKDELVYDNEEESLNIKARSANNSNNTIYASNEQNRLNKLKQASRDQKLNDTIMLKAKNPSMTNLYTNLVNNRSPLTTPERPTFKNNLFSGRNMNNLETSNARPNSTGSIKRNSNSNNFNSNSVAANSLLKIATMANSNGSPVATQKNNETDFNDFNSFLKSDTFKEDKDSRTQQRLWLQRENSILDLSTDQSRSKFDSIFQPFSVDAKRDFENIAKEYNSIKRFGNPLVENLKKIQSLLEINTDNKTASESKLSMSDRTTKTGSNKTSFTNLNINNTQSVKSYNNSVGKDGKQLNNKNMDEDSYERILANIWDTEAKKMINFNQNIFQENSGSLHQSSSFLMRHNSSNGYFRNSPRTLNSANSHR
ncbi:uncharacterized protein HGUI_02345 [Hanseniaspora guilliermondii]|uniref:Uncharacterized protein n=1 Tax=Hanseniaspora guilliermondii TaxID=56406 RepID=A0A1L0CNU7_9ASCO|nr:uncharacterized protein HGUI_02345 [Hanseniaspora guilliermondii]